MIKNSISMHAHALGQHNAAILARLGRTQGELARLHAKGVL